MERSPKLRFLSALLAFALMLTMLPVIPAPKAKAAFGISQEGQILDSTGRYIYTKNEDGTVTLVKFKCSQEECNSGVVTLPSELDEMTVTVIAPERDSVLFWMTNGFTYLPEDTLKKIIVPNTVTEVGYKAFGLHVLAGKKPALEKVFFEEGSQLKTIEKYAFDGDSNLKSVNIPGKVTSIGEAAFRDCSSLTSIELPSGLKSIDNYTFQGTGLISIEIPASVTQIGYGAFWKSTLKSITIPDTVESIAGAAFEDCSQLEQAKLPENTTYKRIEDNTFNNCGKLKSIKIPDTVTFIGSSAFYNCAELKSIEIDPQKSRSTLSIGNNTFNGCTSLNLENLEFPKADSMEGFTIGENAFLNVPTIEDSTKVVKIPLYKNYYDRNINSTGNDVLKNAKYLCKVEYLFNGVSIENIIPHEDVWLNEKATKPTQPGYENTIWYTNQTCTTPYNFDAKVTEDIKLYSKTSYTVTFVNPTGPNTTETTVSVKEGAQVARPNPDPTATGYTFGGWYADAAFKTEFDFNKAINENTTVYAHWTAKKYTITKDNNGSTTTEEHPYQSDVTITAPAANSNPGHTFTGWKVTEPAGLDTKTNEDKSLSFVMPAGNVKLEAQWDRNSYKVTFVDNEHGNKIADQQVEYNGHATEPTPAPTAKNFKFEGWFKDGATTPFDFNTNAVTSDTTLTAKWTEKRMPTAADFDYKDGKLTPKDPKIIPADKVHQKFYEKDENGEWTTEVTDLDPDTKLPTKPGEYVVKADVDETDTTAEKKDLTGDSWTYTIKKVPTADDFTYDKDTGKVTPKEDSGIGKDDYEQKFVDKDGKTVPKDDLDGNGVPKKPGDYTVKVDVTGNEKVDAKNDITGTNPEWKYTVPESTNPGGGSTGGSTGGDSGSTGKPGEGGSTGGSTGGDSGNTKPGGDSGSGSTGGSTNPGKPDDKDNKKTPSADDFTYDPSTGKVTPKDDSGIGEDDYEQKFVDSDGNTVPKEDLDPDTGLPTKPGDYTVKVDVKGNDKVEKKDDITGTDPEWKYTVPEEPTGKDGVINPASVIVGAGVAVVGGATLGWQAYNLYAELAGYWMLPAGFAFPTTREMLALALWNDADQPAAVNNTKYSDLEEGSESQTAARWAVENELIKPLDDEDTAFAPAMPVGPLEVYKAFKAEKAWQKANK